MRGKLAGSSLFTLLFASITILTAVLHLPYVLDIFAFPSAIGILASGLVLYILALNSMKLPYWFHWTGFARLPIFLIWVMLGLGAASISLVLGALISNIPLFKWQTVDAEESRISKSLGIIANQGMSILGAHAVFMLAGGKFPVIISTAPYFDLFPTVLAFIAASVSSFLLILYNYPEQRSKLIQTVPKEFVPELSIFLLSFGLPLSIKIFGETTFLVLIALVALRNLRQVKISHTEDQLQQRIREMSTLNSLGHAISSQLSLPSVLETIYREVSAIIPFSHFYVALYDDEQEMLDYRFVMVDGKRQERPKQKLADGVVDFVVREKQSVFFVRDATREQVLRGINPRSLKDAQYMATPLMVSEKMVGVLGLSHATNPQAFSASDFELLETVASQASLAIRNATLYDRTVRLADNLAIINQSLQDVMFNLDRSDALKAACEIARNITRAQKAAVFLLQPNRDNRLERVQALGFEDLAFIESLEYKSELFQNGLIVVRDVNDNQAAEIQAQAKLGQFQAYVQIPLKSGNTVVGCLCIYHDKPYFYETTELNLLTMLANQITAALDNADLLQALELYAAEQAQLVHLSRISGISLDLERIIHDVCDLLRQIMNMERIEIGLYSPERGIMRLESPDADGIGLKVNEIRVSEMPEMERLLLPDSMSTVRAFYHDESLEQTSPAMQKLFADYGDAMIAMIPMRINHQSIGLLLLGDTKHRLFNDNDYRLLEMATHQVTAQIHNAQVHTLTEEALVQRLEQLGLIEEIAQQISQALDFEVVIENVLEAALQSTQAEFASLALIDDINPDTFEVIWREVVGDKLMPNKLTLQITQGVVGHVVRTGETLLIGNNSKFPDYYPPPSVHPGFLATLAVPLKKGEKVIGVLNLEAVEENFFTMEQASYLKSLAGHAAISMDNAYLLEQRERQINTLTLLRELSLDALSVIETEKIIQAVLRTALVLLDAQEAMLYRYDGEEEQIKLLDGLHLQQGHLAQFKPTLPETIIFDAAERATLQLVPDTKTHIAYTKFEKIAEVGHRSLIAIPIMRRRKILEVLCVGFSEVHLFNHHDLNTVDLLSVQLAGHLENAALNETIRSNNDRMRTILDSTRDGIILLNLEGRVQEVNEAAISLSGIDFPQYLQEKLQDIIKLPELKSEVWDTIVTAYNKQAESIHEKEFSLIKGDIVSYIKTLVFSVTDDAGTLAGRLLVLRDITQETELRDFRDRMQSYVLHDLRGPLSSIITSMYVAMSLTDSIHDETLGTVIMPTLQVSLDSANDLLHMVDTLRDLPMMSEMQIEPQMVGMRDLAEKAYNSLSSNMKEANIEVNFDIADDAEVYADSNLIRRVLMNLMHNAFKFTPENGQILIRMDTEAAKEGYIRVMLADTGPGIPDEERERIFGRYVQIKGRKPRAGGKGLGLGLNFCKLAVEAHGGQIWVEAQGPLSGACFAFTLPMSPSVELANIRSR